VAELTASEREKHNFESDCARYKNMWEIKNVQCNQLSKRIEFLTHELKQNSLDHD